MIYESFLAAHYLSTLCLSDLICVLLMLTVIFPFMSTIIHEAGHYYAAKIVGISSKEFSLGRGPVIICLLNKEDLCQVVIRACPFGGRVTYKSDEYVNLSSYKKAFLSAGGWLFDFGSFVMLGLIYLFLEEPHCIFFLIMGGSFIQIIMGLSPITSDGRKFIAYLFYGVKQSLSAQITT